MDINFVKYVINGANLVKIGHFWRKWSKSCLFGIFGEIVKIIFSPKVSKNDFSQVYGHKIGQKCH